MSFFRKLIGGIPSIPSVEHTDDLVEWFLLYDEKARSELGETHIDIPGVKRDILKMLDGVDDSTALESLIQSLMAQHNISMIALASEGQLEYSFTPQAAAMKLTTQKIRAFLRIAGYIYLKRFGLDINDLEPAYPSQYELDTEDIKELLTEHPELVGRLL